MQSEGMYTITPKKMKTRNSKNLTPASLFCQFVSFPLEL